MKVTQITLGLAAALALFAGSASAASINVNNFSFEDTSLAAGGFTSVCPVSWTCSNGGGEYRATTTQYAAGSNGLTGGKIVPDGNNAAYTIGIDTFSQFTTVALVEGTTYTLDVWVGCRESGFCTNFGTGSNVIIELLGNNLSTVLASQVVAFPGQKQWVEKQLSYVATAADVGKTLGIGLLVAGQTSGQPMQVNWDAVTLTSQAGAGAAAVPEPGTMLLLGTGLLGARRWRRRR